jgi:hypothetical protein
MTFLERWAVLLALFVAFMIFFGHLSMAHFGAAIVASGVVSVARSLHNVGKRPADRRQL